ncbi:MAG: peptidoglycan-binding protein [Proteobacteria bacterium]|nr:peptidoglycan-binding protein [Pseudomonadota bacterium]
MNSIQSARTADAPASLRLCALSSVVLLALAGCGGGTMPTMGASKGTVTGAAGGETAKGENTQLTRCAETLGTLGVEEDQAAPWYAQLRSHNLGSTVPVLRLMIQQSNCFVIVERSVAGMSMMTQERALQQSGEMRGGSNFGKGQMVAADYSMRPSIQFAQKGTGGVGGLLGGFGLVGAAAGVVAGGLKSNEAATTLLLIDNRSGVQISAAEGSAKNYDFNVAGGLFGGGLGGGAGAYSNTPEGKIITAAFADSFNQMVEALKNYKAQTVRGGLGTGGRLGVDGGTTPASQETKAAPASKPAPKKK